MVSVCRGCGVCGGGGVCGVCMACVCGMCRDLCVWCDLCVTGGGLLSFFVLFGFCFFLVLRPRIMPSQPVDPCSCDNKLI